MGTKINPGPFDCYANAKPDEPMFILLARDKHAPALVLLWAAMRELDQESPEKVLEARQTVEAMLNYQRANRRQTAGMSTPVLAGILELIKVANHKAETQTAAGSSEEFIRLILARTKFE